MPGDASTPPLERMIADDRKVFVPSFATGSYDDQLNALRQGKLMALPGSPRQPLESIDWSVAGFGKYYATKLHGWSGLAHLLNGPRLPKDVEDSVAIVIRDWFRCNGVPPGAAARAWHEGTIVMRLSAILLMIDYYRAHGRLGDLRFIDLLYMAVTNKDRLLVSDAAIGNHALRHDVMLMSFIGNLPYVADREAVGRLAADRLNKAAEDLFSLEGIWKEHAPAYGHYALRLLTDLDRIAKSADFGAELPIMRKAASTAAYLEQILTPEGKGRLPPIGSSKSPRISRAVADYWGIRIFDGPHIQDRSLVFQDYGQAVYSSSSAGQLYVLFQAAQNLPAGKRHADALSFIVHAHGRWWLVDSGHYSYEGTPIRRYLQSARAHNTYLRGEQGLGHEERIDLDVVLTGFSDVAGDWRVTGRSDRFADGTSWERAIAVDKGAETIRVRDSFSDLANGPANGKETWRGFLHLAPGLEVVRSGGPIVVLDPLSGREMRISIKGAELLPMAAGRENPLQGWVVKEKRLVEAPVLEFETRGSDDVVIEIAWDRS